MAYRGDSFGHSLNARRIMRVKERKDLKKLKVNAKKYKASFYAHKRVVVNMERRA